MQKSRIVIYREASDGTKLRLGVCYPAIDGWRFMPNVASRKPSRKGHATWQAAVPRWTGFPKRAKAEAITPMENLREVLK